MPTAPSAPSMPTRTGSSASAGSASRCCRILLLIIDRHPAGGAPVQLARHGVGDEATADPPKAPSPPSPPGREPVIKIERPKSGHERDGVEISIDERGVRVTPRSREGAASAASAPSGRRPPHPRRTTPPRSRRPHCPKSWSSCRPAPTARPCARRSRKPRRTIREAIDEANEAAREAARGSGRRRPRSRRRRAPRARAPGGDRRVPGRARAAVDHRPRRS